jgi:hypothetical protein
MGEDFEFGAGWYVSNKPFYYSNLVPPEFANKIEQQFIC